MQPDPDELREHYISLSDEELHEIERADLVPLAQQIFDEEVRKRKLSSKRTVRLSVESAVVRDEPEEFDELEDGIEPLAEGEKPAWAPDAAEVYSWAIRPGATPAQDAEKAQDALEAAGIPCYLDPVEDPSDEDGVRLRLLVPGKLNLRATSILDRDIFNEESEATWKVHLETLSDRELRAMKPEVVFCGLYDRIDRVERVYAEEIARRGLAE